MLVLSQLILISTEKGLDFFLITDRFQLVSWLSMLFLHLPSCVQYFFLVSFHFITHILISKLSCFVFFECVDYLLPISGEMSGPTLY